MKPIALGLLPTLILTACVSTQPADLSTLTIPTSWQTAGNFPTSSPEQDLRRWWSSFGDAQLTRLIQAALENSPDLESARQAVRQAQAQRSETAATLFPSLGYTTGASTAKTWDREGANNSSTAYSAGLSASWEPDLFGGNRQSVRAADAVVDSAKASLASARASLATETAIAYFQLRASEKGLEILRKSIAAQEETTQIAQWRTQAGQIDDLELDQSISALESARAAIHSLEQNVAQTKNLLNLLAGYAPGSLKIDSGDAIPQPSRQLAIGIPHDAIRQRPDVRAAGSSWLAAIARTEAAEAEQFPSLSLSGTISIDSVRASRLIDPEAAAASIIAGLTGPIFDAGQIRAQIEGQDAVEKQAFQSYRSSILTALSEVEDALIACRQSEAQISTLEKAVASARSAAELAAGKYEAGVIDITPVLDTQRSQLSTERELLAAQLDHASAYAELYRAAGGGW
ncbi:MAG: efflux transporter outer membrane subunit [Verrucomicrobiales bacterium]